MGYAVLWISHVAFSLFLIASIIALCAHLRKQFWRRFWPILSSGLVVLPFIPATLMGFIFQAHNVQPRLLFWYGLFQIPAYLIGISLLLFRGLSGPLSRDQRNLSWPTGRLIAGFTITVILFVVTLGLLDKKVAEQATKKSAEATERMIQLLPQRVEDSLNAYRIYVEACKKLGPEADLPKLFLEISKPSFDPIGVPAAKSLEMYSDAIEMLRRGAAMPHFCPDPDVNDYLLSSKERTSKLDTLRYIVKLLALASRYECQKGDVACALRDISSIESTAEHLRTCSELPLVITALLFETIRIEALEYLLAHMDEVPREYLQSEVMPRPSVLESYWRGICFDWAFNRQLISKAAAASEPLGLQTDFSFTLKPLPNFPISLSLTKMSELRPVRKFLRVFIIPTELESGRAFVSSRLEQTPNSYGEAKAHLDAISEAAARGDLGILSAITLDSKLSEYLSISKEHDVLRGLGELALAVTRYKIVRGEYPTILENLIPDFLTRIPSDPFDGGYLKVNRLQNGMDLYSAAREPWGSRKAVPIHFYLGRGAYEEYRIKPSIQSIPQS